MGVHQNISMTKEFYIDHPQSKYDAQQQLDKLKYPYRLMAITQRPTEGTELEKWSKSNAYFHRGLCPIYSQLSGLGEDEAKEDLQRRFACVIEHKECYEVESIGGMSLKRLVEFIENCQQFLAMEFGHVVDQMITENKLKYTKTKKVKR